MKIIPITEIQKEQFQTFDCGSSELNCYLKEYAFQNNKKNIAKTFVLIDGFELIGYYSLSNAQIAFEKINEDMKKRLPRYPIPSIRLARLAVSKDKQGNGYGKVLLKDAFLRILAVSKLSGTHFIIVDAKEQAESFYEQFGFIKLSSFSSTYILPISVVEKALTHSKEN